MATIYSKLLYMVLPFVFVSHIHFEKAKAAYCHHRLGHRTTVVHGVAAHCSRIFHPIFLHITIHYFSSTITMNYTENVMQLLAHARTVDTRCSSLILLSAWK